MFMQRLLSLGLLLATLCSTATAQFDCSNDRYYEQIFTDLEITMGVTYGENDQPTIFDPNATQVLELDVYEPMGDSTTQRPLIIWAFGGAFVAGSRLSPDIVELCTRFAKAGYVCASIDYRLTSELALVGDEHTATTAVLKATHDMRAAVRYLRNNALTTNDYGIDPNAIWVGGVSAGGFAALHLAYLDEVSEVPSVIAGDIASLGGIEGNSGTPGVSSEVTGVLNLCGALAEKEWIVAGDPVLMSVHGTEDDVVPYGADLLTLFGINLELDGSAALHPHVESLGIPNAFTSFPGAGHTPFALGTDVPNYMDTTWWAARDFVYEQTCGYPFNVPEVPAIELAPTELLTAYPTPANESATIMIDPMSVGLVEVSDMNGKRVQADWNFVDGGISIDTRHLPNGMYVANIFFPWSYHKSGGARLLVQH